MFVAIIRMPVTGYSMFRAINYRGNFIRSISTIKFCPSPEHERPAHNSTEQASHSYKLNRLILPYTFPTKNNSLNGHTVENELNPRIKFSLLPPCRGAKGVSGGKLRKDPENSLARFRLFPLQRLPTRARLPPPFLPPPVPCTSSSFCPVSMLSRATLCFRRSRVSTALFASPPSPTPTLSLQRKFRVSFAALRRRYIPNHPYLSAYTIRASYIPARVPVENVLRSTVQFVQVPETFVPDMCRLYWEEKKVEKKKRKESGK